MIPFSKPTVTGFEQQYIEEAVTSGHLSGDGPFTKKCHQWFEYHLQCEKVLLTPSCTAALEMAAILLDIQPGDEVIVPSYTFVSTANAFVLRGAKIVFVDIRPDTMNIDEKCIEAAITKKTKAIVPVHYAGVACEMDVIMTLASKYNLFVVEDAAQGMMATYKGRPLGTIGHLGTYSFHATKNYTSGGEGGALIVNDERFVRRSEIIREKGTNRSQYIEGIVDKYSWVDLGSSYLPSEIQSAYLWAQLEKATKINHERLMTWNSYYSKLSCLKKIGKLNLPQVPSFCQHNAHIFYIDTLDTCARGRLISFLTLNGITSSFHYVPLHSSTFGRLKATFSGNDNYTTEMSGRLLRLPIFLGVDVDFVCEKVIEFYTNE